MPRPDARAAGKPTICAVIPVHNRALLVERAIRSVIAQERPPDEIVVVDDGSTDGTAEAVRSFGDRVTLIQQRQSGVSTARNLGVGRSRSDYVAFLDSDDIWDASHLARMEDAIVASHGEAVLYFSDLHAATDPPLTYWELSDFSLDRSWELRRDSTDWLFRSIQPVLIVAAVVRRDAYIDVGGSEARLVRRGDTHLLFKLGLAGPICAVAGSAGVVLRDGETSITATFPPDDPTYVDCTIWLYRDLLDTPHLTRKQRAVLRRRLADAYWDLARRRAGATPLGAVLSVGRAMRRDPAIIAKRFSSRLRRASIVRSSFGN